MSRDPNQVAAVFAEALAKPSGAERDEYLNAACAGDAEFRRRVEVLLQAHAEAGSFLQRPAADEPSSGTGAFAPEASELIAEGPGSTIGPYKLLQKIGEGGMGAVYMAEQEQPVRRRVALKVIKPGMDSAQVIARFEAERQALALMDHPNIAKVLDAGTTETGRPFFVMELVKGVPVTKYCDQQHLTPKERLELFVPVCQAVQHAHQKGVIHRDLKPSNVLIALYDGQPVPKVIDFGVAKAVSQKLTDRTMFTEFGQVIGTLEYMSPEQAELNQLDIDTRSDVYSLGVLLYELLTGSTPLDRKRLRKAAFDEMLRIIREEEPPKPSTRLSGSEELPSIAANRRTEPKKLGKLVRGELDWIVMRALEKDRARRYETANAFARDVQRYLADEPVEAGPPSATYRLRKLARRYRKSLATAALVVTVLVLATAVSVWQATRAEKASQSARAAEADATKAWDTERHQRQQAEEQRDRALKAEAEAKAAGKRAEEEKAIAQAINQFLQYELLGQASEGAQADTGFQADPDVTVRTLLDRASARVGRGFRGQPRVEAAIRHTISWTYRQLIGPAVGQARKDLRAAAELHSTRAVELLTNELGEDHPETLAMVFELALAYHGSGQYAKAESYYQRCAEGRRRTLGARHFDTLRAVGTLASLHAAMGRVDEAEKALREVLNDARGARNAQRVRDVEYLTLNLTTYLGQLYSDQGRYAEAEPLLREALEGYRRFSGNRSLITVGSMNGLARMYTKQGRHADAEPLLREHLAGRRAQFKEGNPNIGIALTNLGTNLLKQGKYADAEPLLREHLALWEKRPPQDEQRIYYARSMLGESIAGQGRYAEAEPLLTTGYEGIKTHLTSYAEWARAQLLTDALERLVRLYDAWGKPDEAAKWRKELEAAKAAAKPPDKP